MANQDAPFGFRAVRMSGSGPSTNGQTQYLIANGYNTAIFQGDPVEVVAGGSLEVANGVADVDFTKDVMLQDDSDGKGPYIKEWNLDIAQPTNAQLSAQESAADTEEANNQVRNTRRIAYGDIGDQLDEIYKDIDAWKARIKKIKDDNPKE